MAKTEKAREIKKETQPIVETADIFSKPSPDPEPIQEPDKTTIDMEKDDTPHDLIDSIQPDVPTAEIINSVVTRGVIKRAEAFVSSKGESRVFIYAEGGVILKFVGHFKVSRN